MAVKTLQSNTKAGLVVTFGAADVAGDKIPNDGHADIRILNSNASPITMTINGQKNCDQGHEHDETVTINAGVQKSLGRIDPVQFNNASGQVELGYSEVTDVTLACVQN